MQSNKENVRKSKSKLVKEIARELGFDFCGIAPVQELAIQKRNYKEWLSKGCHGKMGYLEKNTDIRFNPALLVENAKSLISLAINYFPDKNQNDNSIYKISKYAYGKDYHLVLKEKMAELANRLNEREVKLSGRFFVDSAPVIEKVWAQKAGLGWIGKNGCLIIPKNGSYYFLCELIVDTELAYDKPHINNYCGSCTKCIDNCPTGAINRDGYINAKKCISYLTIELKDDLNQTDETPKFNNWIFGCDVCQDVCPWNRFSKPQKNNLFSNNETILNFAGIHWEGLSKQQYNNYIKKTKSPIARIKYEKLLSNIKYIKSKNIRQAQ